LGKRAFSDRLLVLQEDGSLSGEINDITSALVGIRYLSSHELTSIIEYYHNGGDYSAHETALFHDLVDAAESRVSTPLKTIDRRLYPAPAIMRALMPVETTSTPGPA